MSEHIPDIETYTKRLNWYLQEHYPANKKITAEEWNALFLALMNQGNAQEETLEKICNEILPPHVTAINYLLDKEANHTPRIEALEQVATNHEGRIDNLEDTTTEYGGRISSLENTVSNHGTRIDILEVDALDSKSRIGVLENTVDNHSSRIQILEAAEINHENRISDLENLTNEHSSEISDLDTLTQTHTTQLSGLRTDVDSNTSRIGTLENTMLQKAFKTETTLKYNVSNIPSAITYAKNGIKDLLIEFYNEEYVVPVAPDTTAYRKGSVIVIGIEEVNDNLVQTEIFKFKEGIVTRQITSNNGTITAISDWKPINNAYLTDLDNRVDTNTTEIANIKRDYATNVTVNAKETALQNQITANRTDINNLLGDYVKKIDNANIDYLTRNELAVSDTGALVQIERLKNITKGVASNPRQTTPIPVVDNKARLFLPQEIASLRDLVSWKNSLLGEALNYIVDFSDFPTNPSTQELQTYLDNKWTSMGGTTPIIDQTTMTDENIPLSYRWYVNENAWIYSHGVSDNLATNNLYNEQGTLVTPGSTGKVLGSNKKFHIMYETNGEGAVVGLDALEQNVLNNTADIADVNTDLSTYKTSNNTRVGNVESRATALETRATTIEGILPTKLDKITNTLNMQGLYGRKADGTHNLLGADSNNTVGSIMLRDLNGNAHIGTPTSNTHITNKKYVDDADSALNNAISNLTTTVNGIDTRYQDITDTIASNLANETTARTNADTALQNSITSLTNNKMDKTNPTGTGTFNLTGLMVPTDGIKFNTLSKAFKLYGDDQSNNIFFEIDGTHYFKLIDDSGKLYSENHEVARKDYADTKVDKVVGKQLSTEDFTTAEKNKLAGLNNYDDTQVQADITTNTNNIDTLTSSFNNVINNTTKIANSNGGFSAGTGSSAVTGGAVGSGATVTGGGGVGNGATTGNGFAGGYLAKTVDSSGNKIDAIQLGQGTNATAKTLQIYGDNIYNADTHTFTMSQSNTLKWQTKQSANPYIGYCTDSYDGTFVIASKEGTTYTSGLAIGDTSGNLLWKGQRVLSVAEQGNDYIRFDSGIQICWGVKNNVSNNAPCNFQQAFISNPTVVACQTGSKSGWNDNIKVNDISTTSFTVNSGGTASYYWLAIGKWK